MVVSYDMAKGETKENQSDSPEVFDDVLASKMDHPNYQLTVTTMLSIPGVNSKSPTYENGLDKVESLYNKNGKSLESVKSVSSIESDEEKPLIKENWYFVTIQVLVPFMLAGVGTIGAGIVLGNVNEYEVFREIKALYVLVPALLGLKGNLDMCLASRLSTQANLGNMDQKKEVIKMIIGNISLVQVQAIVATIIVSIFAMCVSSISHQSFEWQDALLLATASILTGTLSCFTLDFVLIAVIYSAHKMKLNPDNVATPLAASIGDVVSLLVLSTFARLLYTLHDDYPFILIGILSTYILILLPIWILIVRKNEYTKKILTHGWIPVLSALVISGTGGLVLDRAVDQFDGYEVFQPIINGIGGNLVSVQASRISTMLHQTSIRGVIPPHTKQWVAPWTALFKGVLPAKTARILIGIALPGQTIFLFLADLIYNQGVSTVSPAFAFTYLIVGITQIMALLYIAHLMVHTMWKFKIDPDNGAIPYLTSLGDLFGSSLLLLAFMFLKSIHQGYTPITPHES